MPYVYILKCFDGSFYTGSTLNLEARLIQHNAGEGEGANYTRKRLPVVLVYCAETDNVEEAFGWEKRIQGWSRAKKIALIEGRFEICRGCLRDAPSQPRGPSRASGTG